MPVGARERRQQVEVELDLHVTHLRDVERGIERGTEVAELLAHLAGGLDVEVGPLEPEPVLVGELRAGAHAQQRVVRVGVVGVGVVGVVGDHRAQAEVAGHALQLRPRSPLLGDAVILQLDEEVVRAEQVTEVGQHLRGAGFVVLEQVLVHLGAEAAREHDQALVVLLEQVGRRAACTSTPRGSRGSTAR